MSSGKRDSPKQKIVKAVLLPAALLMSFGCTTANPASGVSLAALEGEALRRLFSNGYNTYLAPVERSKGVTFHRRSELFRPNGTYHRALGRTGLEGWYTVEGDLLCVTGDGFPKQCRKVLQQGPKSYVLIDVSDNSQVLMELWQVK